MKKILLIATIFIPLFSISQELDEAYLASLPEGVRQDVIDGMDIKAKKEKPIYRRPSSMVQKPEDTKYLDESAAIQSDAIQVKRFGKSIFKMMQSSFMPINEPNFDGSYILDFGDTIEVQLIGQRKEFIEKLAVKRDGSINIPDIGKIFVSGLSLESASTLIKAKVSDVFIGTNAFISLVNIRDIQVLIAGNAFNPGVYTLNGNSNVLHAISMAGGLDEIGSYRSIDVIREGKVIDTLDIYDIFIHGRPNFGPKLRSGDSIFVKPFKIIANLVSGVNRPHSYELKDNESLQDLIDFGNGFKSTASLNFISLQRLSEGNVETIQLNQELLSDTPVKNGDTIVIREYEYGKVTIRGAVNGPGEYFITEGVTLGDIVKKAGGYKDTAYPFGGFLNNIKTKQINIEARDRLYNQFIKNIISNSMRINTEQDGMPVIMDQIKNSPISGRVMAEFDTDILKMQPDLDTFLENDDEILIPYVTQQVYVYGEINTAGTVRYSPGKSVRYYLDNAGGFLDAADNSSIFIVHPNGKTQKFNAGKALFKNLNNEVLIYPGSIIYVPTRGIVSRSYSASIWAPIISSVALSVTSLSVLNNSN